MTRTTAFLAFAALAFASAATHAQVPADYPSKPIRILVPFSAGGSTDLLARGVAQHLSDAWKQPVIVDNRPGAGGIVALSSALDAPADGHTLLMHSDGFSIAPAIFAKLPYDVTKDFSPIALVARAPNVVAVAPDGPYKTLKQLVDAGKAAAKLSYASAGVGSAQHMQAAKFSAHAKIVEAVHVPFKGTPESLSEVMSGRVDFVFAPLSNAMPLITAGRLRPLAVSTADRSALLKDVPTVAEAGFPGFAEQQWWGLFAPSAVPAPVQRKIEAETRIALKSPAMLALIERLSSTPGDLFGKGFATLVNADILANTAAAKAANITAK